MPPSTTSIFDLPERIVAKADPAFIADDEVHLTAIAAALQESVTELTERLTATRLERGGAGTAALERDQQVHRLTARLQASRRYGLDMCLGHLVPAGGGEPVYIGRLGLSDARGRRLLVDWRSPMAAPFFGATHADPMGLARRRRYHWAKGRITDYWDEVFVPDEVDRRATLDDQSAFLAGLGVPASAVPGAPPAPGDGSFLTPAGRPLRMRDVLGTIQADQDAIIRAGSHGALVVNGGPGTGKTVVALHRTAYLLYSEPKLQHRGGVLFVGPHRPYLSYIWNVLPSLGEDGVQVCTLADLVPESAVAVPETDPQVARLKASAALVAAIEPAAGFYEEPPTHSTTVQTPWAEIDLTAADWRRAFDAPDPGTPHNEAREAILDELVEILIDRHPATVPAQVLAKALRRNKTLLTSLYRAWPLIDPADLVGDLWTVPAYLRRCAPSLTAEQVTSMQRTDPRAWTSADLPLLDAARFRLGDPGAELMRQRQRAAEQARRDEMSTVIDDILAADHDGEGAVTMLRGQDLRDALVDEDALPRVETDQLAGTFAHIVVDEAQELTDAQWAMLARRCPSRSFTIVGDRAQARHGFPESWRDRLRRNGFQTIEQAELTVNYRTPQEIMTEAEAVIRAVLPDANVPVSIRHTGIPVHHGDVTERESVLQAWSEDSEDGIACVIGDPTFTGTDRVLSLTPELAKGLEFDLVVLVDPLEFGTGMQGAVDRYVAMTRSTRRLVVLTS